MKVCLIGIGNCASALVQGVKYYSENDSWAGLVRPKIGSYTVKDISFHMAFDVDRRKLGRPLKQAIFEKPNCCMDLKSGILEDTSGRFDCIVEQGPRLDGIAEHMFASDADDSERFFVSTLDASADIAYFADKIKTCDVLVNYLPVGSQRATEFWAFVCLAARVPMVNCIPVFIASDPEWALKFSDAKVAVIGDDMKSQFGASVMSQMFQELAKVRGHRVKSHIQQNSGGNTDFFNMTDKGRLASKKISKENVLKAHGDEPEYYHAGPSDYIRFYGDTKIAHFHLELEGFGGAPVILDARLEVQDSPNSAGVVIDAIRYVKIAQTMGLYGPLDGPSAFTQKSPPRQMKLDEAVAACDRLSTLYECPV